MNANSSAVITTRKMTRALQKSGRKDGVVFVDFATYAFDSGISTSSAPGINGQAGITLT